MKGLIVKNLFGRFDYNIDLKSDGLTILTGPNGYGKSTILRIISNLTKGVYGLLQLMSTDFSTIIVEFEQSKYEIVKTSEKFEINGKDIKKSILKVAEKFFERRIFRSVDNDMIYDRRSEKYFKNDKMLEYLSSELENESDEDTILNEYVQRSVSYNKEISILINELQNKIGKHYFIKEQRLIQSRKTSEYSRNKKEIVEVIREIPTKLRDIILDIASSYSQVSTRLDSSYPSRLLRNKSSIDEKEFISKNLDIKKKYNKLREYDLTPEQPVDEMNYDKEFAKALSVYFDDFNEKYAVFEPLINQLDLYTDIINSRLSFKKIQISKEIGLSVINDENVNIDLSKLSSGEQQEIVLFYELIFEANQNSLLLIDEPEISLHIAWQRMFTEDLMKISSYKNFNIVIATHSPQIINNRWNNQIDLGELFNEFDSKQPK